MDAFAAAGITLYAPAGSAAEQLLIAAGYELNYLPYTVSFETNGGALIPSEQAVHGTELVLPEAVKDGCTLAGWYADADLTSPVGAALDTYTVPDADVTLYAAWTGEGVSYDFLWKQAGDAVVITGSKNAETVTIPATVNGIPVTGIADSAFANDQQLRQIMYPETLQTIGAYAFFGSGLVQAELPETVTDIGRYAFAGCADLQSVDWPAAATELPEGVFSGDVSLTEFTIPEGVTVIQPYALEGCKGLTALSLPDSVIEVKRAAFQGAEALQTLAVGTGLTALANDALNGCVSLTAITVESGNTHFVADEGVLYYADHAGIAKYPAAKAGAAYTVHANALVVEANAFADAQQLETVQLPTGLIQMGRGAFARSGLAGIDLSALSELQALPEEAFSGCESLSQVLLPAGLAGIGAEAFSGCYALARIDIPDAVESIGSSAFASGTTLVGTASGQAEAYARANGLAFEVRGAVLNPAVSLTTAKTELTLLAGIAYTVSVQVEPADTTDAVIWISGDMEIVRADDGVLRPLKSGQTEVYVIAGEAELTISVTVVDSPIRIEPATGVVFTDAPLQLQIVYAADNYPAVDDEIAWTCEGATVTADGTILPTATGLIRVYAQVQTGAAAQSVLLGVDVNTSIFLPAGLTQVEEEAFRDSDAIDCVIIPDQVTDIGAYAFADCDSLQYVIVPDSVVAIDSHAFENSPGM